MGRLPAVQLIHAVDGNATQPPRQPAAYRSRPLRVLVTAAALGALQLFSSTARAILGIYPAIFIASALCVLVHEAGHLACAVAARFRVYAFVAGPLRVEWRGGRRHVGVNSATYPSGYVGAFPAIGDDRHVRGRLMAFAAGGPLANLAFAAVLFPLATAAHAHTVTDSVSRALAIALRVCAFMSLFLGISNLIPFQRLLVSSDGWRLRSLWRRTPGAERWPELLRLVGTAALAELRPRDWDPVRLERILAVKEPDQDTYLAHSIALMVALDRGAWDAAEGWADQMWREARGTPRRPVAALQLAFVAAGVRGDVVRARRLLRSVPALFANSFPALLARASVLVIEGPVDEAETVLDRAEQMLDESVEMPGIAVVQREWIAKLCAALRPAP